MRRAIVLVLLFLLPTELLAGVFFPSVSTYDTEEETTRLLSSSALVVQEVSRETNVLGAECNPQQVSLDFGEASDLVHCLLKAPCPFATAPPFYIAVALPSIVLAMPKQPAI